MVRKEFINDLKNCVESFGLNYSKVELHEVSRKGVLYFTSTDKYSFPIDLLDKLSFLYPIYSLGVCGFENSRIYVTFSY